MLRDVVKSLTSATQRAVGRRKRTIIVEAAVSSIDVLARDNIMPHIVRCRRYTFKRGLSVL